MTETPLIQKGKKSMTLFKFEFNTNIHIMMVLSIYMH